MLQIALLKMRINPIERIKEKNKSILHNATTSIASRLVLGNTIAYSYRNIDIFDKNVATARNNAKNPKSSGEKTLANNGENNIGANCAIIVPDDKTAVLLKIGDFINLL
jgi:hypothetical protein